MRMAKLRALRYVNIKRAVSQHFQYFVHCGLIADLLTLAPFPAIKCSPSLLSYINICLCEVSCKVRKILPSVQAVSFLLSPARFLEMNYSYVDCRAMNMWQRLYFNTELTNASPTGRADAWRRLLAQLNILRRRLVYWFYKYVSLLI